jgi:hypothetical protein
MSRSLSLGIAVVLGLFVGTQWAQAQITSGNPIIKHIRSADPSAQVWEDGQVWVYASHDQNNATDYSTMDGYHAFSSFDMINWTDHGEILHSRDVSWRVSEGGWMFAPDAAYKDGTYYLYFPTMAAGWKWRVGVATSDKPEGPFEDVGHYIEGTDQIDPTCFVDDDGQAYLIWGGDFNDPKIARLKENMTELAEEPRIIEYGASNFGEGPFMHKRDGVYYFSYTCQSCYPYQGYYAMSDSPYGPFEYKGELNLGPPGAQDHHSIIEYHGQWYYFYHVGNYNGGSMYRRNVCVDSLFYNEDGTMREIVQSASGVGPDPIGSAPTLIVPGRLEAEHYFRESGIDTIRTDDSTGIVSAIHDSDWIDFVLEILGTETYTAHLKVLDPLEGSKIYLMVDEVLRDSMTLEASTDILELPLLLNKGRHTLKLLFNYPDPGLELMELDWIELFGKTSYYRIEASATEGGSIEPEGSFYLAEGDSMEFYMDWELFYRPEGLLIDGVEQDFSASYTFQNVKDNLSIEATYTACSGISLNPFIQVNDGDPLQLTDLTVNEGDLVVLRVEYEDEAELTWLGPGSKTNTGKEWRMDDIQVYQAGNYSAFLTDSTGCKLKLDFMLEVKPFVLDVYEAERWIAKAGVVNDICLDTGGGQHLGYINHNDWSSYMVEIEETGIYDVTARVATASAGGMIELSLENEVLCSIPVSSDLSGDWQDWYTTTPVEAPLIQGSHELVLTYKGDEGYLFNLNWFDLNFNRALAVKTWEIPENPWWQLYCFQQKGREGIGINYQLERPANIQITIMNLAGQTIRILADPKKQSAGSYTLTWDGKNEEGRGVPQGIYLVVFRADYQRAVRKVVYTP